jgi:hypothetical protein
MLVIPLWIVFLPKLWTCRLRESSDQKPALPPKVMIKQEGSSTLAANGRRLGASPAFTLTSSAGIAYPLY